MNFNTYLKANHTIDKLGNLLQLKKSIEDADSSLRIMKQMLPPKTFEEIQSFILEKVNEVELNLKKSFDEIKDDVSENNNLTDYSSVGKKTNNFYDIG